MNFLLPLLVGGPDMAKGRAAQLENDRSISVYKEGGRSVKVKRESPSGGVKDQLSAPTPEGQTNLNSYLAGLFEGDGHIWLQKDVGKMAKKHNPRFCITFGLKNEPLAKKLLSIIEFGHIRYKPQDNAVVLTISPVKGLTRIVKLINGELRTPKIDQLYNLIDWLNKHHNTNIPKLPLRGTPLGSDS